MHHLIVIILRGVFGALRVGHLGVNGGQHIRPIVFHRFEHPQLAVIAGQFLGIDLVFQRFAFFLRDRLDAGGDDILRDTRQMRQRRIDNGDNAEQHDHVDDHRQAAAGHAHALFFIQIHLLLLQLLLILRVFFLQAFQTRRQSGAVGLAFLRFKRQREGQQTDEQRKQENGDKIISDILIDKPQDPAERGRQKSENIHVRGPPFL